MWGRVTASIRPLSRDRNDPKVAENTPEISEFPRPVVARTPPPQKPAQPRRPPTLGTTLDATWDRRLRSGTVELDRILDLHGLTLDAAWEAIDRGLEQSIARRDPVVLLITGHHRPAEPPVARGKIRAAVHDWLRASRHAGSIAAVRGAHRRHGGGGSLYLVLRRR